MKGQASIGRPTSAQNNDHHTPTSTPFSSSFGQNTKESNFVERIHNRHHLHLKRPQLFLMEFPMKREGKLTKLDSITSPLRSRIHMIEKLTTIIEEHGLISPMSKLSRPSSRFNHNDHNTQTSHHVLVTFLRCPKELIHQVLKKLPPNNWPN